jgi:rhodanese-related sulfurtransferase
VIVDVREPDEFAEGHLPGGRNIPLGVLSDQAGTLEQGRALLVHCKTGSRAAFAATALRAAGWDVSELDGGFEAWRDAGLPVIRPANH